MFMQPIFLNLNLAIFARNLLTAEKGQKAGFLRPPSSQITLAKEKKRRKEMSEEEEFKNGDTLSFFCIGFLGD